MGEILRGNKFKWLLFLIILMVSIQITEEVMTYEVTASDSDSDYNVEGELEGEGMDIVATVLDPITIDIPGLPTPLGLMLNAINLFMLIAVVILVVDLIFNFAGALPFGIGGD